MQAVVQVEVVVMEVLALVVVRSGQSRYSCSHGHGECH